MPERHVFQFECPCCDEWIEVDTRSGKARAVDPTSSKSKADLDKMLEAHKRADDAFDSMFNEAKNDESKSADRLEDMLSDAKRRAKADRSKPKNPFDLE